MVRFLHGSNMEAKKYSLLGRARINPTRRQQEKPVKDKIGQNVLKSKREQKGSINCFLSILNFQSHKGSAALCFNS